VRKCTPTINAADRYRQANLEAARIIIADPQYRGLPREVAERTLANAHADAESWRDAVLLGDGDQVELFDPAVGSDGGVR
jgi:hypothetical protein